MDESKRQHIITEVAEALRRGDNTDEVFETYLYRCMFLYRSPNPVICSYRPAPKDVYEALSNNDVICKEDICILPSLLVQEIMAATQSIAREKNLIVFIFFVVYVYML